MVRSHRKAGDGDSGIRLRTAKTAVLKGRACGNKGMRIRVDGSYGEADITILEGLEAVRKRPGMYIGSTGPSGLHHLVWEVVDNSVDEAMAGRATRIDVTILADGGCRVSRRRRGHPGRAPPEEPQDVDGRDRPDHPARRRQVRRQGLPGLGRPARRGHLGGQRPLDPAPPRGGPRGPALGGRVREGRQGQAEGRRPPARRPRTAPRASPAPGTTVTFWPDAAIFDETEFRAQTIVERMQIMAFLNKGLEIRFTDERTDPVTKTTFKYAGGIVDFVKHLNASKESLFRKVASFEQAEEGQEVEIALQWNTGYHESIHSFANGISTIEGGMHVEGFSKSLTNARQPLRPGPQPLEGEGGEPQGRGHPRGPDRHHLGALARPAVRGADQGQAGQRLHPLADRAHDQQEAGRVVGGEPARGQPDRAEVAGPTLSPRPRRGRRWRRSTTPSAGPTSASASEPTARHRSRRSPPASPAPWGGCW